MARRNVNIYKIADNYNHYRNRNLGRRYTRKQITAVIKDMGFIYPILTIRVLIKKGYLEPKIVTGRKMFGFTILVLSPQMTDTILIGVRKLLGRVDTANETPIGYLDINEFVDKIKDIFKTNEISRLAMLREFEYDVKDILEFFGLRGQKATYIDL